MLGYGLDRAKLMFGDSALAVIAGWSVYAPAAGRGRKSLCSSG